MMLEVLQNTILLALLGFGIYFALWVCVEVEFRRKRKKDEL